MVGLRGVVVRCVPALLGGLSLGCGPGALGGGASEGADGNTVDETDGADSGGLDAGDTGAAGETGDDDDDDDGDPADESGDDGDDDDDETGGDTGEPTEPGLCGADATEILAIALDESQLHVIHGDASSFAIDVTPTSAPAESNVSHSVSLGESRLAVASSWAFFNGGITTGSTLRVFDLAGSLQWQHEESGAGLSQLALGAEGSLIATRDPNEGDYETVLLWGPDDMRTYPGFHALGPFRADGLIPGRMQEPETLGPPGWMNAQSGVFTEVTHVPFNTWYRLWDDAIVYRTASGIAVERPDGVDVIELGPLAELHPTAQSRDWMLLGDGETQWARVSLAELTFDEIELAPLPDVDWFGCYSLQPAIDDEGALFFTTRDAVAAQAYRYEVEAQTWTAVGEPVTAVDMMDVYSAGLTALVLTHGQHRTFCPPQEFDPAPDLLSGHRLQVVHPDAEPHLLPEGTWSAGLNRDGSCATYGSQRGTTLLDVLEGETLDLPAPAVHYLR